MTPNRRTTRRPSPLYIKRESLDSSPRLIPGVQYSPKTDTRQVADRKRESVEELVLEQGGKHYHYNRDANEHYYRFNSVADAAACRDMLRSFGIRCRSVASTVIV